MFIIFQITRYEAPIDCIQVLGEGNKDKRKNSNNDYNLPKSNGSIWRKPTRKNLDEELPSPTTTATTGLEVPLVEEKKDKMNSNDTSVLIPNDDKKTL